MDTNPRGRCWVATIPWPDAATPTESVVPLIGQRKSHAKLSRANDSVSIWFTFDNQVRASTVSNGFDCEVVLKRVRGTEAAAEFDDIPSDWEWSCFHGSSSDSGPSHSSGSTKPDHGPAQGSVESTVESDDDLIKDMKRVNRIRKRIRELDDELGTMLKSCKHRWTAWSD